MTATQTGCDTGVFDPDNGSMNISGYAGLAYVYWKSGKSAEAEEELNQAEALNPSDPRVYFARAQIYAGTGRFEQARREYGQALRLDPSNAESQAGLEELNSRNRP